MTETLQPQAVLHSSLTGRLSDAVGRRIGLDAAGAVAASVSMKCHTLSDLIETAASHKHVGQRHWQRTGCWCLTTCMLLWQSLQQCIRDEAAQVEVPRSKLQVEYKWSRHHLVREGTPWNASPSFMLVSGRSAPAADVGNSSLPPCAQRNTGKSSFMARPLCLWHSSAFTGPVNRPPGSPEPSCAT